MTKSFIYTVLVSAVFLSACGSKTDANEKNFGNAIETDLKKIEVCLPFDRWPFRVMADDKKRMAQMKELESLGFVSGADFESEKLNFWNNPTGQKIYLKIYSLTEQGKKFFLETKPTNDKGISEGHLCYGHLTLDKVVKWENGSNQMPNQMMLVSYTYKMNDIADWAKSPALLTVLPYTAKFIKESAEGKESQSILKLTNLGWETAGFGLGFGDAHVEGKIIQTYDKDSTNPADFLPVVTPTAQAPSTAVVTPAASSGVIPAKQVESSPSEKTKAASAAVSIKPPQVQKILPHTEKSSSGVQIRQININD